MPSSILLEVITRSGVRFEGIEVESIELESIEFDSIEFESGTQILSARVAVAVPKHRDVDSTVRR